MANLKEILGIDKVIKLAQTIKQIGGVRAALKQRYLMDQNRVGELNDAYFMPRNRWVVYPEKVWLDYDASQVPPEWHGWLHHISCPFSWELTFTFFYITDVPPTEAKQVNHKWLMEHRENTSIYQDEKYIPYSTTRPKVQAWQPDNHKQQ
ncbi:NADH:ubiquinone oxidoreductase domain containing protein [Aphelenchoides besseyi]|nr:NADH:ubiquinone oxidoreductase domain containing protein [Aphelenchoides besseyi]